MRSQSIPSLILLVLCGVSVWASTAAATREAGATAPVFVPCRLEHPLGVTAYAAECATISVAEDPDQPQGRRIDLAITRIPAVSRRKSNDPLWLIAGGPGMSTREMYAAVAGAFARAGRDRDILLVDQRGTGGSALLRCSADEQMASLLDEVAMTPARLTRAATQCLTDLEQRQDLRLYTTSIAVRDLEQLRVALGYPLINLYGVSYGSRVAQHYLRRYPQQVRSVILDGVVPPGLALGPNIPLDAEAALEQIFARCRAEEPCRKAFGDPRRHLQVLQQSLARSPRTVTLPDPRTAAVRRVELGPRHLAVVLRLSSYSSTQAALLPLVLHEAAVAGNDRPLASLYLQIVSSLADSIADGMHNSVVCSEDLPFVDERNVDRAALQASYLGGEMLDLLQSLCRIWPRGRIDADFHEPLASDVPILLLSGSLDPVTPPSNADRARQQFARHRHLLLEGEGHGQLGVYCMDRILANFLRDADPQNLDTSCLDLHRPRPFHLTLAGPGP